MSKIDEARAAGYSDDEILSHMSKNKPKLADALKEGYSATEILSHLGSVSVKQAAPSQPPEAQERSLGNAAWNGIKNLPSSAGKLVSGLADAVTNPGQTLSTIGDLARGAAMQIPGANFNLSPEDSARAQATYNALADEYKNTYGSWKGFKEKLATDPLGPVLDAATLASGGAGAAGKVGKVANMMNPLRPIEAGVNALASGAGKTAGAIADMRKGPELAAGRIAREAAGSDLDVIRQANMMNPDAPSSVAAGGVSGDTYQAMAAKGQRPDMSAVATQLSRDESDMMRFGDRLQPELKADLQRRIDASKAQLDAVNLNAEQAVAGQGNLNALIAAESPKGTRLPQPPTGSYVIPGLGKLSAGIRLANGTLDLIQQSGKFKSATLQKLADGMQTGRSANELLATLPTSERSKLIQLLKGKPHWLTNPVTTGSLEGINVLNQSME